MPDISRLEPDFTGRLVVGVSGALGAGLAAAFAAAGASALSAHLMSDAIIPV